jgi:cephalosporin hydroxylase
MSRVKNFLSTVRSEGLEQAVLRTRFVRPWIKRAFEIIYWHDYTWNSTKWLGVPALKYPSDAWSYQEIIYDTKPDLIIETGTKYGGSALYFASLFDLLGAGRIVTIDIEPDGSRPVHPRIHYLTGSSTSEEIVKCVDQLASQAKRIMVILDSDHSEKHVREELRAYHRFVSKGCYLVVEDTNVNGHPVAHTHGPGPMEAIATFLPEHPEFQTDPERERLGITAHPKGFLKRVS